MKSKNSLKKTTRKIVKPTKLSTSVKKAIPAPIVLQNSVLTMLESGEIYLDLDNNPEFYNFVHGVGDRTCRVRVQAPAIWLRLPPTAQVSVQVFGFTRMDFDNGANARLLVSVEQPANVRSDYFINVSVWGNTILYSVAFQYASFGYIAG
ncbi:MAG TPA: hypothetical protein VH413_06815 [Verrucomicrobiae bacterium]|jgi:hypothetical protein|nr:hypothetical protein [Verrucomicrobiae bacterium]